MPCPERAAKRPARASGRYGVADVAAADVAVADVPAVDVPAVEVGVGLGGSVAGGLVACGATVCRGVAVRCGDGVAVGTGEPCGVRRGAGRFVCDGACVGETAGGAVVDESLAVPGAGGLTHV
jgi:hypothetical protein